MSDSDAGVEHAPVQVVHPVVDEAPGSETGRGSIDNHAVIPRIVIRHVLERQLVAGQSLGAQLVGVGTDVSVALAHAPVTVVDEIRGGATLPVALAATGREVRGAVSVAGSRVRTAVGEYVGSQSPLPNAVVVGAADVAETVLRAQGTVAGSALDAAFTVATAATRGGDVRAAWERERYEVLAQADAGRAEVGESWSRAGRDIRGAAEAFQEED